MAATAKRARRLKPTGHSALIESLIQPAIVIASTLMSAIAAYVLALDELTRILDREGAPSDYFIVALCAGMGFLIDMAIIVSATRYKMHAIRGNPSERRWLTLAKWVLIIGLASETMTLFYFFVHLSAQAFPDWMIQIADWIHSALAVSRSFLPPIVVAYFAAGVLPVMFDRADRNREIKSRTSANVMLLIDRLSQVEDTDDKAEMLRALGGQLMLDTYATYDSTERTTEDDQLRRDAKLLTHLARIHRLDWSPIAEDVAPELRGDVAQDDEDDDEDDDAESDVFERLDGDRSNTLPDHAAGEDDEGPEPPENDPSPPRGKRPVAPESAGADDYRSNVLKVATDSRRAAAVAGRSNTSKKALTKEPQKASQKEAQKKQQRDDAGMSQEEKEALREARLEAGRTILAKDPDISVAVFARRIAMATHHSIHGSTAHAILTELRGRKPRSRSSVAAQAAAEANH